MISMDPLFKAALLRTLGFFLLTSLSAWLFVLVEYESEETSKGKYQLLRSLYMSMTSKYNMTIEEFNNFSNMANEALSDPKPRWTFIAAFEFVISVVTTIGYGHITPQTPAGQILCVFISLFGIPITLLTLKSIGELIAKRLNVIITTFEKKILKRSEPKQVQSKSAMISVALMVVLMMECGLLVMYFRDWTFIEGVYFWFITFTTIGFGDYVISVTDIQSNNKLTFNISTHQESKDESVDMGEYTSTIFYDIFSMFNCLFGLCIVSSVINSIMACIEEGRCRPRCFGCFSRKIQDHVNSEQNNVPEQQEKE